MTMLQSADEWKRTVEKHPEAHILQTAEWGELKSSFGWKPYRISASNCSAQILFKPLPGGLSVGYIPKGPLGIPDNEFWNELIQLGKKQRAIMIKIETDASEGDDTPLLFDDALVNLVPTKSIQPGQTIIIDISGEEKDILDRMKQKTRYNIHLAEKKDIRVESSNDIKSFYEMMIKTGGRDGFGIHTFDYYQKAFNMFSPTGKCLLMMARYNDLDLAGLMLFKSDKRCWYFYGASTDLERNRMPVYLLQWEAIRWAKAQGCTTYDLWGIPDHPEAVLEAEFMERSEGLWGVYRFKRGFGGRIVRSAQTKDLVLQPLLYKLLMWWTQRRNQGAGYD